MPERITFTVPAIPIAQPRQRHRIANGSHGQFVTNYTPAKSPVSEYKATVKMAASVANATVLEGPLLVSLVFVFPRGSKPSWLKKASPWFWPWKRGERVPHITKPDRDNLDKATLDAMKGLVFKDDKQACVGTLEKWIADAIEQPHVEITIEPLVVTPLTHQPE